LLILFGLDVVSATLVATLHFDAAAFFFGGAVGALGVLVELLADPGA
jgi:hypothetical protein